MTPEQSLILLRCLELGMRAAADAFEQEITPLHAYDNNMGPGEKVVSDSSNLQLFTKVQLVQLLARIDPGFDHTGMSVAALRKRVEAVARNPIIASEDTANSVLGGAFSPPGVVADPALVATAGKLLTFFEEVTAGGREEIVRAWQARMQCDLRCVRPGGCCPNTGVCGESLTDSGAGSPTA